MIRLTKLCIDLKIPVIENLGVTKVKRLSKTDIFHKLIENVQDLNDAIDFTNNDLRVLGNFPRLNRLQSLLLNNNRISKIESGLETYVPNLHTIILTNNLINELGDLEPLTKLKKLTHLSLLDNPVAKKQHYRLYVIYKFPQLRVLDFNKVKLAEKNQAIALFSEENGADNDFVKSITENKSKSNEFAS